MLLDMPSVVSTKLYVKSVSGICFLMAFDRTRLPGFNYRVGLGLFVIMANEL